MNGSSPDIGRAGLAFAELARIDLGQADVDKVLQRVVEIAATALPVAAHVSMTVADERGLTSPAATGPVAQELDETQYAYGHGPCVDAAFSRAPVVVRDMEAESRWPDFLPDALSRGVLSSLSVPLPLPQASGGAVNLYATEPRAFDEQALEVAEALVGYAAVTIANAHRYAQAAAMAEQMRQAMSSRAVIEQAKGFLAAQRRITPDAAFELLAQASQHSNRKLREIATDVITSASRPPTPQPPR